MEEDEYSLILLLESDLSEGLFRSCGRVTLFFCAKYDTLKIEVNWNPKNAKSGSFNNFLTVKLFKKIKTITTTTIIIVIRIIAF